MARISMYSGNVHDRKNFNGRGSNGILPYTLSLPSFYHRWQAPSIVGINIDILLLSHHLVLIFVPALFKGVVQYT